MQNSIYNMMVRKLPSVREDSEESEYDIWVSNEELNFIENVDNVREKEPESCWKAFFNYWCFSFF